VRGRFRLTPQAKADLREILLNIATNSPETAKRVLSKFEEGLQRLAKAPGSGHFHEELLDRRYRFWNFYSYVVCYVWEEKPIQIIAVIHGARQLAALLQTRIKPD
jgi:plasmid stabilization system protein ParE